MLISSILAANQFFFLSQRVLDECAVVADAPTSVFVVSVLYLYWQPFWSLNRGCSLVSWTDVAESTCEQPSIAISIKAIGTSVYASSVPYLPTLGDVEEWVLYCHVSRAPPLWCGVNPDGYFDTLMGNDTVMVPSGWVSASKKH